jgi:hypothetical protein
MTPLQARTLVSTIDLNAICKKVQIQQKWDDATIARAEHEYREYLAAALAIPDRMVPPSRTADEIWHAHILDTQKYADDCKKVFGGFLHHVPNYKPYLDGTITADTALCFNQRTEEVKDAALCFAQQTEAKDAALCFNRTEVKDAALCFNRVEEEPADAALCFAQKEVPVDAALCFNRTEQPEATDAALCFNRTETPVDAALCFNRVEKQQPADAALCFNRVEAPKDAAGCVPCFGRQEGVVTATKPATRRVRGTTRRTRRTRI